MEEAVGIRELRQNASRYVRMVKAGRRIAVSRLPDRALRFLDAIHLATTLLLGDEVEAFITYDKRLASAARSQGVTVTAPTGAA